MGWGWGVGATPKEGPMSANGESCCWNLRREHMKHTSKLPSAGVRTPRHLCAKSHPSLVGGSSWNSSSLVLWAGHTQSERASVARERFQAKSGA